MMHVRMHPPHAYTSAKKQRYAPAHAKKRTRSRPFRLSHKGSATPLTLRYIGAVAHFPRVAFLSRIRSTPLRFVTAVNRASPSLPYQQPIQRVKNPFDTLSKLPGSVVYWGVGSIWYGRSAPVCAAAISSKETASLRHRYSVVVDALSANDSATIPF